MKRKPTAATSREFFQFLKPSGRLATQQRAADAIRTYCEGRRVGGILVVSNKRKSPLLSERAGSILRRWRGWGMGTVIEVTACQEYTTRQTLKQVWIAGSPWWVTLALRQNHSAPSLSRTR